MSAGPSNAHWSSKITFVMATIGFSVGLGNIWRFPYLAGESGGGAFVIIYLACVFLIGIPIVIAELLIGRRAGTTPASAFRKLALESGRSPLWRIAGAIAMITAFLILSYYCVIGGWTFFYTQLSLTGELGRLDGMQSQAVFDELLSDPKKLIFWQVAFLVPVAIVCLQGLNNGIERAVTILMPALFFMLVGLAVYGLIAGDAERGLTFLFRPDWSSVTPRTFLDAIGQAFFSVGVGMAAMMVYGSFLSEDVNIPETSLIVVFADTAVAIIAGIAIFPFVFANGLSPTEGPGLVFVTLPTSFSALGQGAVAAFAFFALLAVAAFTSAVALFEVYIAWGEERGWSRLRTVLGFSFVFWLVGLTTVFSFNEWSEFYPLAALPGFEKLTIFDSVDRLTASVGLPLGGLLMSIFVSRTLSSADTAQELGLSETGKLFRTWRFLLRWPLPVAILLLIVMGVQA